ncbi:tetratricopeptide repeat protein [Phocaeicola plebeius]|uniref:tetratricopeptide repeat protein n=1 Tax=Phocaeicola plebeius TaxID=310297 RepID=UPI0039915FE2
MDDKLKQQINSWTKANEDRKVIDLLEGISPAERGFEETGLLARAYNYVGEYEKALVLLESIREVGEQDTNWNFRMGYALYYLDRYKEALSYFTKADELTPEDVDTIEFIRQCNIRIPFKSRVDAFWAWFVQNEAELSRMVEKRGEYDSETSIRFIEQGVGLIAKNVHFNIGGNYEFTFSVEGEAHLFYLYPYLISRMPESLRDKWHFFPYNLGTDCSFELKIYGLDINMEEVYVCAKYDDKRNDFAVSFYEKGLCSLPENQGHGAFCIMMEIMLGEGLSYRYVSKVERTDRLEEGMFPLPALRGYIVKTLKDNGKEVLENPKDVFVSYQLDPEKNDELRYDVAIGSTNFSNLVSQYYENNTTLFDKINHYGAQAVFLAFPYNNISAEHQKTILDFRYALEDRIEKEILDTDGLGLLLGGAIGTCCCYMDFLLYDVKGFIEKVLPVLREYPQYSFYLSDFRQHCQLIRLTDAEMEDC